MTKSSDEESNSLNKDDEFFKNYYKCISHNSTITKTVEGIQFVTIEKTIINLLIQINKGSFQVNLQNIHQNLL